MSLSWSLVSQAACLSTVIWVSLLKPVTTRLIEMTIIRGFTQQSWANLRSTMRAVAGPTLSSAARVAAAFAPPAPPAVPFAPAVAVATEGAGETGGLQRRALAGVDDLEGVAEGDEEETLERIGRGFRELSTGLAELPGLRRRGAQDAASLRWSDSPSESSFDNGEGNGLGQRLALGIESLRDLLSDGIWFAVPKRKASYRVKRLRQMSPLYNETNVQNFYPCPKCDKGA